MVSNTGGYLDVPFHRFADGLDLADSPRTLRSSSTSPAWTQLPLDGFRFHAAPPLVHGMGTFPVRAYAVLAAAPSDADVAR